MDEVWDNSDDSDDMVVECCSTPKVTQEKILSVEGKNVTALVYWVVGFLLNFQTKYSYLIQQSTF